MQPSLESKWAKYLQLNEADIQLIRKNSTLSNPLGFLIFLDLVSKQKDARKLTTENLRYLKAATLSGKGFENMSISLMYMWMLLDRLQELQKWALIWLWTIFNTFAFVFEDENKSKKKQVPKENRPKIKQQCSLLLFCQEGSDFTFPKRFEIAGNLATKLLEPVNLGNGKIVTSEEEAKNILWKRELILDGDDVSQSRFIPKKVLDQNLQIPAKFGGPYDIVRQVLSPCQEILGPASNMNEDSKSTDSYVKDMKWAQTLLDVWQFDSDQQYSTGESFWKEEDWLESLTAPLLKEGPHTSFVRKKFQDYLKSASSPKIPLCLNAFYKEEVRINTIKQSKEVLCQNNNFAEFLKSTPRFLTTFFVTKILGLKGPESESLVQKTERLTNDRFQKYVFRALKTCLSKSPHWITIFHTLNHKTIQRGFGSFIIILGRLKKVLYIEYKHSLTQPCRHKNAFAYIRSILPVIEGWEFLTWICYEKQGNYTICSTCRPFLVKLSNLGTAFDQLLMGKNYTKFEKDYEALVKNYLFATLSGKTPTSYYSNEQQSNYQNLPKHESIFWCWDQLNILQRNPRKLIIRGHGILGTGKTEVLKKKTIQLADHEGKRNFVAFLIAKTNEHSDESELLITKYLRIQFKPWDNKIKVKELEHGENIALLLTQMFPECQNENRTIHVIIDQATKDNMEQIQKFLEDLPLDCYQNIWIVDKFADLDFQSDFGFEIDGELQMNLRTSQEIQESIPLVQENESLSFCHEKHSLAELISSYLKQEMDTKQVAIVLNEWITSKEIQDIVSENSLIEPYGLMDRSTNSEERLERFLDPKDNKECPILLTVGHLFEGFDVETIVVVELHQILAKWTLSCARKKLRTLVINEAAHPALLHQFQVPKVKEPTINWMDIGLVFEIRGIEYYSRLNHGCVNTTASYLKYSSDQPSISLIKNLEKRTKLGQKAIIKQYNVVQEKSSQTTKVNYPLFLLFTTLDKWKASYGFELKGETIVDGHPLATLIKSNNVTIVELTLSDQILIWMPWERILIAEIVRANRLGLELRVWFDFLRLFSIWSRICEEFKQNKYIARTSEMDSESYNRIRRDLLSISLIFRHKPEKNLTQIIQILTSFVTDQRIQDWTLIKSLLGWLNPNFGSTVVDYLISWEFPNFQAKNPSSISTMVVDPNSDSFLSDIWPNEGLESQESPAISETDLEENSIAKLRKALTYGFFHGKNSTTLLNWSLIFKIWKEKQYQVWRQVIGKNFPKCIDESWFQGIALADEGSRKDMESFLKENDSTSILQKPNGEYIWIDLSDTERLDLSKALIYIASDQTIKL